jgi:general secretion pathway protein A
MYNTFFGLTTKPFELVPNPQFLYPSQSHKKVINYLHYGLSEGVGFILFTGEVGSGKTTILRDLIRTFKSRAPVSVIFNTRVDGPQLLAMINEDFGLEVKGKDKQALLRELNDFLIDSLAQGMLPIIIIDEAQNLSPDTLEEVRLLSNLELDSSKLVQVVLVGQPELRDIIAKPALRQLRQRIVVKCHLDPLGRDELQNYIYHRLQVAGHQGGLTFQPEVFDIIYEFSSGIPRLINLICDYLLLAAFSDEVHVLSGEMCQEVARELSWQESAADQQQAGAAGNKSESGAKNVLVKEFFRRFDAIQQQLDSVSETVLNMKKATESLDLIIGLVIELESKVLKIEQLHYGKNKSTSKDGPDSKNTLIIDLYKNRN